MEYRGFTITEGSSGYYDVRDEAGKWGFGMPGTLEEVKKEVDRLAAASPTKFATLLTRMGKEVELPLSEREFAEEPIDLEVRELVAELNFQGLNTEASCAGHSLGGGELPYGLVMFAERLTPKEVATARGIAKSYNLEKVRITHSMEEYPRPRRVRTSLTFAPLSE